MPDAHRLHTEQRSVAGNPTLGSPVPGAAHLLKAGLLSKKVPPPTELQPVSIVSPVIVLQ